MLLPVGYVVFAAYMKVRYDQPPAGFTSLVAIMVFLASVNLPLPGDPGRIRGPDLRRDQAPPPLRRPGSHWGTGSAVRDDFVAAYDELATGTGGGKPAGDTS